MFYKKTQKDLALTKSFCAFYYLISKNENQNSKATYVVR